MVKKNQWPSTVSGGDKFMQKNKSRWGIMNVALDRGIMEALSK